MQRKNLSIGMTAETQDGTSQPIASNVSGEHHTSIDMDDDKYTTNMDQKKSAFF